MVLLCWETTFTRIILLTQAKDWGVRHYYETVCIKKTKKKNAHSMSSSDTWETLWRWFCLPPQQSLNSHSGSCGILLRSGKNGTFFFNSPAPSLLHCSSICTFLLDCCALMDGHRCILVHGVCSDGLHSGRQGSDMYGSTLRLKTNCSRALSSYDLTFHNFCLPLILSFTNHCVQQTRSDESRARRK